MRMFIAAIAIVPMIAGCTFSDTEPSISFKDGDFECSIQGAKKEVKLDLAVVGGLLGIESLVEQPELVPEWAEKMRTCEQFLAGLK